jgi:RHS repeat-associated protein
VQTEYTYESFGRSTVTGAINSNSYRYTGREDDGTGLYYYRARYYNPVLQRFLSEDPRGFAANDLNLYAYVGNNPTTFFDPLGEEREKLLPGECKLLRTQCGLRAKHLRNALPVSPAK